MNLSHANSTMEFPFIVSDSQIKTSAIINLFLGLVALSAFIVLRGSLRSVGGVYQRRRELGDLFLQPPRLLLGGLQQAWSWAEAVMSISDADIVRSAGVDALLLNRMVLMGIQVFSVLTVLGLGILLPVYYSFDDVVTHRLHRGTNVAELSRATVSNLPPGHAILWLPAVATYLVTGYVAWVLLVHCKSYAELRVAYLLCLDAAGAQPYQQRRPRRSAAVGAATDVDGDKGSSGVTGLEPQLGLRLKRLSRSVGGSAASLHRLVEEGQPVQERQPQAMHKDMAAPTAPQPNRLSAVLSVDSLPPGSPLSPASSSGRCVPADSAQSGTPSAAGQGRHPGESGGLGGGPLRSLMHWAPWLRHSRGVSTAEREERHTAWDNMVASVNPLRMLARDREDWARQQLMAEQDPAPALPPLPSGLPSPDNATNYGLLLANEQLLLALMGRLSDASDPWVVGTGAGGTAGSGGGAGGGLGDAKASAQLAWAESVRELVMAMGLAHASECNGAESSQHASNAAGSKARGGVLNGHAAVQVSGSGGGPGARQGNVRMTVGRSDGDGSYNAEEEPVTSRQPLHPSTGESAAAIGPEPHGVAGIKPSSRQGRGDPPAVFRYWAPEAEQRCFIRALRQRECLQRPAPKQAESLNHDGATSAPQGFAVTTNPVFRPSQAATGDRAGCAGSPVPGPSVRAGPRAKVQPIALNSGYMQSNPLFSPGRRMSASAPSLDILTQQPADSPTGERAEPFPAGGSGAQGGGRLSGTACMPATGGGNGPAACGDGGVQEDVGEEDERPVVAWQQQPLAVGRVNARLRQLIKVHHGGRWQLVNAHHYAVLVRDVVLAPVEGFNALGFPVVRSGLPTGGAGNRRRGARRTGGIAHEAGGSIGREEEHGEDEWSRADTGEVAAEEERNPLLLAEAGPARRGGLWGRLATPLREHAVQLVGSSRKRLSHQHRPSETEVSNKVSGPATAAAQDVPKGAQPVPAALPAVLEAAGLSAVGASDPHGIGDAADTLGPFASPSGRMAGLTAKGAPTDHAGPQQSHSQQCSGGAAAGKPDRCNGHLSQPRGIDSYPSHHSSPGVPFGGGALSEPCPPSAPLMACPEDCSAEAAAVDSYYRTLFPDTFQRLVPVCNHRSVDELLFQWDAAVKQLAAALLAGHIAVRSEQGAGATSAAQGPTSAHATAHNHAAAAAAAAGLPPAGSPAAASILRAAASVQRLQRAIATERSAALRRPTRRAYFALFATQRDAAAAAQCSPLAPPSRQQPLHFRAAAAPPPDSVYWPALWTLPTGRAARLAMSAPLLLVLAFPIGVLTGALTNLPLAVCGGSPALNALYWPWFCRPSNSAAGRTAKALLTGVLPPLLSLGWNAWVLPMAMYLLSAIQSSCVSLPAMDAQMSRRFFWWSLLNMFCGAVLGGGAFAQLGAYLQDPGRLLLRIGTALPTASNFFLHLTLAKGLASNMLRVAWPHLGAMAGAAARGGLGLALPRSWQDLFAMHCPPGLRFASFYNGVLQTLMVGLAYAVTAPLIAPVALLFFATAFITWRYAIVYIYERQYESGGSLFPVLFSHCCGYLLVGELFTGAVLLTNGGWAQAGLLWVSLTPAILAFRHLCEQRYLRPLEHPPLSHAAAAPPAAPDPALYLPPALRLGAAGWYPEGGKVWEQYGLPKYVV